MTDKHKFDNLFIVVLFLIYTRIMYMYVALVELIAAMHRSPYVLKLVHVCEDIYMYALYSGKSKFKRVGY